VNPGVGEVFGIELGLEEGLVAAALEHAEL
jgi:hypothetical protein